MEVIPAIDLRGGKCVSLCQGDYTKEMVFSEDAVAMSSGAFLFRVLIFIIVTIFQNRTRRIETSANSATSMVRGRSGNRQWEDIICSYGPSCQALLKGYGTPGEA